MSSYLAVFLHLAVLCLSVACELSVCYCRQHTVYSYDAMLCHPGSSVIQPHWVLLFTLRHNKHFPTSITADCCSHSTTLSSSSPQPVDICCFNQCLHTLWMKTIQQCLTSVISLNEATDVAQNHPLWRLMSISSSSSTRFLMRPK